MQLSCVKELRIVQKKKKKKKEKEQLQHIPSSQQGFLPLIFERGYFGRICSKYFRAIQLKEIVTVTLLFSSLFSKGNLIKIVSA